MMRDIIHRALCQYQMTNMYFEDTDDHYPLKDLATPAGEDVGKGEDELFNLADFIVVSIADEESSE